MLKKSFIVALAALAATAAGCITPPAGGTVVSLSHAEGPGVFMGQFSAAAPNSATVDLTAIGVGVGLELCVQVSVHSGQPQVPASNAILTETTCQVVGVAGESSVTIPDVIDTWDEADGPLEGRWFSVAASYRPQAGQAYPHTVVRHLSIEGSTSVAACTSQFGGYFPC